MPVAEPTYIEFAPDAPGEILERMAAMAASHAGWINFEPAVHVEDAPPPRGGAFSLFSGRGPDVPLATWTPGEARKGRTEPPTIGILHPAGPNAKATLANAGRAVPDGWVVMQDYGKKGLVVAVPPSVPHAEVVDWLLGASTVLATRVPLTGTWRAVIYQS